jgi:hypothetical protein
MTHGPNSDEPADDGSQPTESVEALLAFAPISRVVDLSIGKGLGPWSDRLSPEEVVRIRAHAYLTLSLDPWLRGLLRRLARGLHRPLRR